MSEQETPTKGSTWFRTDLKARESRCDRVLYRTTRCNSLLLRMAHWTDALPNLLTFLIVVSPLKAQTRVQIPLGPPALTQIPKTSVPK